MPSRAITSALCLAAVAVMCCLDTGTAFVVRGANTRNNNLRRKDDADSKTPLEGIGFGGGLMLPHLDRLAAGSTVRLPRVPSALDHVESSRGSSCLLRLQDVFGECSEGGNCVSDGEEEAAKKGVEEQEGGQGGAAAAEEEVRDKKGGLRSWVQRKVSRPTDGSTAAAAATAAAADAAPAGSEHAWPLPEVAAAEAGWEKGSREAFTRFAEPSPDPSLEENARVIFCTGGWGCFPGKWL